MKKKILHINFFDNEGGAAIAANRIHKCLVKDKIDSYLLVCEKKTNDRRIFSSNSAFEKIVWKCKKAISRNLGLFFKTKNKNTHSIGFFPSNILKKIKKINPDIVHLHWIGNEMISIKQISKINKPLVWTLHDMWAYCGAEHYTLDERFKNGYQKNNRPGYEKRFDLNRWVWNRKKKYWNFKINIVCTSNWQKKMASSSILFKKQNINLIPLPLDVEKWTPINKVTAKQILNLEKNKKAILVGGETSHHFQRKGMDFIENILENRLIDLNNVQILVVGKNKLKSNNLPNIKYLGYQDNEHGKLRIIYSAADLLLMPSRLESFGQMAIEAGSCGTPTVCFENTGTVDIIKHKHSGYVAKYLDINDFSHGIEWCLNNEKKEEMNKNVREFIKENFDSKKIAKQYIALYETIIKNSNYKVLNNNS